MKVDSEMDSFEKIIWMAVIAFSLFYFTFGVIPRMGAYGCGLVSGIERIFKTEPKTTVQYFYGYTPPTEDDK
jgi:hypothetical protein